MNTKTKGTHSTIHMASDAHIGRIPKPMMGDNSKLLMVGGDYIHPRTQSWITKPIYHLWQKLFASKTGW